MSIVSPRKLPSEQRFGLMLTIVFALLGIRGVIGHWHRAAYSAWFAACILFGLLTLAIPRALAPLNRAWFYFGELLGKIVSPIVLGVIFFVILTPIAILTRLFGRDELRLNKRVIDSYWIERTPADAPDISFRNQF